MYISYYNLKFMHIYVYKTLWIFDILWVTDIVITAVSWHIDGLVQERHISSPLAMKLRRSCIIILSWNWSNTMNM